MSVTLASAVPENEVKDAISKLTPELGYLLENYGVPPALLAKLGKLGIDSMEVFAQIEPDVTAFRTFAVDDLGLDPKANIANKVALAKLVGAFEAANTRGKRRREEDAEQRVGDLPRKLPRTTHLDLRRSFVSRHRELRDEENPHQSYLESKLQEVEEGEMRAERLCDVLSLADDDGSSSTGFSLASDGTLKARKTSAVKGMAPANSEQLRLKLKVMAHTWEFVRLKVPKDFLLDFDMHLFSDYADWLLGERVAGLSVASPGSGLSCKPSWALVLSFDFEFRKRVAAEANNKPGSFKSYFQAAYADETLYNMKLFVPLSLDAGASAARALASAPSSSSSAPLSGQAPFAEASWSHPFPPLLRRVVRVRVRKVRGKVRETRKARRAKATRRAEVLPVIGRGTSAGSLTVVSALALALASILV